LLAEEFEVAVSLLQHFSFEQLFEEQTVVLLLRLHEQQGADLMLGSPQLVGLITATLLFAGRFEQAGECIEHLSRFMPQPSALLQRQLIARWQAQQGWLLHLQGRMDGSRAHLLEALGELGPELWTARLMCLSGLTQQALLRGELDVAQAINREALCLARAKGSLVFECLLELDHAQLLEQRGASGRAESLLANLHVLLAQQQPLAEPLMGRIALHRGLPRISKTDCRSVCATMTNERCMGFSVWRNSLPIAWIMRKRSTFCVMPNGSCSNGKFRTRCIAAPCCT
jgi:ATP/maltotriose-dependent transcriptional regulator MalT